MFLEIWRMWVACAFPEFELSFGIYWRKRPARRLNFRYIFHNAKRKFKSVRFPSLYLWACRYQCFPPDIFFSAPASGKHSHMHDSSHCLLASS